MPPLIVRLSGINAPLSYPVVRGPYVPCIVAQGVRASRPPAGTDASPPVNVIAPSLALGGKGTFSSSISTWLPWP